MAESGAGRSTVMRALKELEATGFITRRPQFHDSGAQRSTRYYLSHPQAPHLASRPDVWTSPKTVEACTMRSSHARTRRKYDREFKEGAVRIVRETGKPIAQIARDHGVHEGTLGNWVAKDRAEREGTEGLSTDEAAELKRLRAENAQLRMERDVLK